MVQFQAPYAPEELGYDSSRIEVLNRFLQKQVDKKMLIGSSYALTIEGKLFAAGAVGKICYRASDKRPLKPDTIFRIASVTKLFAAVSVFKLVEDGLCRLDEPMKDYLPEMDTADFAAVTIAQVLSHTGGIPVDPGVYGENKPGRWALIEKEFENGGTDWIGAVLRQGREAEPNTRWEYSSFGYMLLGELIGRVSGVKAERYIEENILKPCGMSDSGFGDTIMKLPGIAGRIFIHDKEMWDRIKNPEKEEASSPWDALPQTGGGMFSTVLDLVKFGNMLLNGGRLDGNRVLGRKAVEKMTAAYTKPHIQNFCWGAGGVYKRYGLGPDMQFADESLNSNGMYYHEGWGRCYMHMDPAERLVSAGFTPFVDTNLWDSVIVNNPQAIICSGLM